MAALRNPNIRMSRKNADNNPCELLLALLVRDCDESVSDKPEWLNCENFEKYKGNLSTYNTTELKKFKDNFNLQKKESWKTCVRVSVPGKKKFEHPLLAPADRKTAKADVYLEMPDGSIIGLSVKQSNNATKTNYSVEKMLGVEHGKRCSRIRKQYLCDNGFPKHSKETRDKVNALFYDRTNPYWTAIRDAISVQNDLIKRQLVKYLYSTDNPFETWEFDGKVLSLLCIRDTATVTFEECDEFYLTVSGNTRNAAKLFYRLTVSDEDFKDVYRVEIRGKGNMHAGSPQFQTHAK